ncbi:MAG: phenylalanine--tRNA ligase subunit beta [Anaerococcus vaginalis]|uniref:phenylalanine--tRNA ligase subunit beta n=2 Tax=Anaerococcus vaginalis TaxID=33037 RepID=UPI00288C15C2|nr:phenylalanine--tRNA ligase subunit beta [Anaerococcus vaginalis]MDU4378856.1 phenylalanine--tRNA ligase subunit beta [Anaerococcus vaginalis]MDU5825024.1 phenylalanine--tRNA ligase subunit beta [Anaerococcus vaginalis]
MLVPLIWQNDYIKLDEDLKTITDRLSETGSHVESVNFISDKLDGLVVGKVLKQEKHPNADKLFVLTIDVGEEITIVTSAKNTKEGDYLIVIKSGSEINGQKIDDHDFFGIVSQGMLTSYKEIGYDDSVIEKKSKDGVIVLSGEFKPGTPAVEVLFSNTPVIEYEITPNRPDCLSIIGMARESAASFDKKITYPSLEYPTVSDKKEDYFNGIEIKSKNCKRFTGRIIKNVKVGESPQWLKNCLMLAGMRPVNNVVDITNFVMLETGQPLHAYDLETLHDRKIIVRDANEGEIIKTLDGEERKLNEEVLVISDGKEAIGLAGIMGSMDSEITENTKTILLESANFDSDNIRKSSKFLNLRSEASSRFEKEISVENADFASKRVMKLITDLGIGEVLEDHFDEGIKESAENKVKLRISRLNSLIGRDFSKDEAISYLKALEFDVKDIDDDTIEANIPNFRMDISIEADLIEEVARLYGMGKVESKPLYSSLQRGEKTSMRLLKDELKNNLFGQKFSEITTYSFISPRDYDKLLVDENSKLRDYIKIINPLGEDYSVMRTTLLSNMLDTFYKNISKKQNDLRFYEIGTAFIKDGADLPEEKQYLTMGLYGDYSFYDLKDFFIKAMKKTGFYGFRFETEENIKTFHPGRCANIYLDGEKIGIMGQISYEVMEEFKIKNPALALEIDLSMIKDKKIDQVKYKALSKFPSILRDYSFTCDRNVESQIIEDIIISRANGLVRNIEIFDIYTGSQIDEGQKSISYKVSYGKNDATLKDEEVEKIEKEFLEDLSKENINLRS